MSYFLLVAEMSTSAGALKSQVSGLRRHNVLPPLPSPPVQEGASGLPESRLAVRRKLLRHRRSKQQQQQLQKMM